MKMVVESMEVASGVDGDGSGGTSPSRQGAGTETSVPRNLSAMAAAALVFLSNMAYPLEIGRASCRERVCQYV